MCRAADVEPEYDPYALTPSTAPAASPEMLRSLRKLEGSLPSVDDTNLLQTALAAAIGAEDYKLASAIRDRLEQVRGTCTGHSSAQHGSMCGVRLDASSMVWLAT